MNAKVSIVVLNWNGKKIISQSLNGLRAQTYRNFNVIVVDNGSSDGSVKFIKDHFPEVDLIALHENLGFCTANNIALNRIEADYAALLNNDAAPDPEWLCQLVNALEKYPEAGFAASKILCMEKPHLIDRAGDSYTIAGVGALRGRGEAAEKFDKGEFVFGACAAAALYRTDMLKEIGFFDENFFLINEDVDLNFRAQLMGYKCVYAPEAKVYHMVSESIKRDSHISVYFGHRNLEWVYVKNMPARLIPVTFFFHLVYDIGAFFFFACTGKLRTFLKAKSDALKGFPTTWKKRKRIQKYKRAGDRYILSLLDNELYFPRLFKRRKSSQNVTSG